MIEDLHPDRGFDARPAVPTETAPLSEEFVPAFVPSVPTRRLRVPSLRAVGLLVGAAVIVALAVATYVAFQQGSDWKRRSDQWHQRAASLEADLQRSEADATALQSRLDGLANEKAQVQDERNAAESQRDVFAAVATMASQTAADLETCRQSVDRTLSATISQLGTEFVAWDYLQSLARDSDSSCAIARASYRDLADAVSQL
jgi:septal ring factor EnvC (AmiA/AmiB activator)